MDAAGWKAIAWSVALAAWSVGWICGLLELTRPYPGILTFTGTSGAFELLEFPTGLSRTTALLCVFLACLLLALSALGMRRWLDPQRVATDALHWAFASKSLNGALFGYLGLVLLLAVLPASTNIDLAGYALALTAMVLQLLFPFCAWNPATLSQCKPGMWWVPGWPGWRAVVVVVILYLVSIVPSFAFSAIVETNQPFVIQLPIVAANAVLGLVTWLVIVVIWFNRGRLGGIRADFRRVTRWSFLRLVVWQSLLILLTCAMLAVPVLVSVMLAIFVIPQYEAWTQSQGQSLALPLLMAAQSASRFSIWGLVASSMVSSAYLLLAQGRLLNRLEVGAIVELEG